MNKGELVDRVAERADMPKREVGLILDSVIGVVGEELAAGGEVTVAGFGKFSVSERGERQGRNPSTGEPMTIPASRSPKFSAAKAFKDAVR